VANERPDTNRPSPGGGAAASHNGRNGAHRSGRHLVRAR
jgi:hypothetical protein